MSLTRVLAFAAFAGLIAWGAHRTFDPYRTQLPFGSTDLSSVQAKLDKLPAADRQLVEDYVKRSNGDVLPAQFADPDAPLTARTFAEAIELQRKFAAQQAKADAQMRARMAERDAQFAPLRAVLGMQLLRREIVPRGQLLGQPDKQALPNGIVAKVAIDDTPIQITTYRLTNRSGSTIAAFKANVDIRKAHPKEAEFGSLDGCWLDHDEPLAAGASVDLPCANTNRQATSIDRAYVSMPDSELLIQWEPKLVRFADGRMLAVKD